MLVCCIAVAYFSVVHISRGTYDLLRDVYTIESANKAEGKPRLFPEGEETFFVYPNAEVRTR